jgi:hypothetical protein
MSGQREHDPTQNVTPSPVAISPERHAVHLNRETRLTTPACVPKGPTLSSTAGRKPAALVGSAWGANLRPALRPKSGQGYGDRVPVGMQLREAQNECFAAFGTSANSLVERHLDEAEIKVLIKFFTLLDTWERKSHATENL